MELVVWYFFFVGVLSSCYFTYKIFLKGFQKWHLFVKK